MRAALPTLTPKERAALTGTLNGNPSNSSPASKGLDQKGRSQGAAPSTRQARPGGPALAA